MVEYLIRYFRPTPQLATLSRGYGRQTKGFRLAGPADTAATLGDEPLQLYRKFGSSVVVAVGERRADALRQLQQDCPQVELVLLDDAFQHRAVQPRLSLLLMDYNRPFYTDHPFPAGRLRERRAGARRADAVVVTKCPADLIDTEQDEIKRRIRHYAQPDTPVFFAGLHYEQPQSYARHEPVSHLDSVVLVSGLANADRLEAYVRQTFTLVTHRRFADHYTYTRADLDQILKQTPAGAAVLTTEKDWVKLDALLTPDERVRLPLFYLPVAIAFLNREAEFHALLNVKNC